MTTDHQCTMIPVQPNTGVVIKDHEGYFCPWCEIEHLKKARDRDHQQAWENGAEVLRLRADLEIQKVNATAVLQAQHERDCAVEKLAEVQRDLRRAMAALVRNGVENMAVEPPYDGIAVPDVGDSK
jgi:hypothetical protein